MATLPRQKACKACADSKRSCDKQHPKCRRCLSKNVDCVYPPHKRQRGILFASDFPFACELPPQNLAGDEVFASSTEYDIWTAPGMPGSIDLDVSTTLYDNGPAPLDFDAAVGNLVCEDVNSTYPRLWFLQEESWIMKCGGGVNDKTFAEFEATIHSVRGMLDGWVKQGYNRFIHCRLYERGMPSCVQDAYTTLAAYNTSSLAMKHTILQIADDRADALVSQNAPIAEGTQGLLDHLARVHSLFVYEFIRLFDGSLRSRVPAERQLSTLRRWVFQMWESVRRYRGDELSREGRTAVVPMSKLEKEHENASKMWQTWILIESIRRSHIIIDLVVSIYEAMTKGWAECAGAVMFTGSQGLWDARSPVGWLELSQKHSPLMVQPSQPRQFLSQHAAGDFDELTKIVWSFVAGKDMIQSWIDQGNITHT